MKVLLDALKLCGEDFKESFTIVDLLDEKQGLVYVNDRFVEETGYTREEVLGRNCRFLQGQGTSLETRKAIQQAIEEKKPGFFNIINYKKNGNSFWNRLILLPIGVTEDDTRYFVGIQLDLTKKNHLESGDIPKTPKLSEETFNSELQKPLKDLINYYRSNRYFELLRDKPEYQEKIKTLSEEARKKIDSISEFVRGI
ncbi:MAG: PAS domain-containing protein [Halobacteriovoraceae bacterium]|nr:PAS domain-containing protein [Halobacteriovoraceae bacterium]